MTRALLVVVAALLMGSVLSAAAPRPGHAGAGTPGPALHPLALVVQRPDGSVVQLAFEIRADSDAQALDAAQRAMHELVPGGVIARPGGFTAQWQRWSWLWDDAELPVPISYNPTGAPPIVNPTAIVFALDRWSSVPTSRFAFRWAGFTDREANLAESGPDGENVISWRRLDCSNGCVVAVTSKQEAHEADMVLNSDPGAAIADGRDGTSDARSVILHESGHVAGLEHSCPALIGPCTDAERAAVMYFQYRGVYRKLGEDDIAGISALYPKAGATPPTASPPPPVTGTPEPPRPEFPVILEQGWNLVQLPSMQTSAAVTGLSCVVAIYDYRDGAWLSWLAGGPPATQSLTTLESSRAYWVLSAAPCAHIFGD
ncbi:MAG: matrixin family metalloprotease [Dehalococcoidia bacterium]|nr:matrixin family metalloprotease [Dehalococcoidia bacterium]